MTWLTEILRICLEKQLLMKYYVTKHLILLKIQKKDGYQSELVSVVYKYFGKNFSGGTVTRANKPTIR